MTGNKAAKLKVTQVASPIGRSRDQRATLVGLGLNKMHRSRVLEDTPAVRGMIDKVRHLVKMESRPPRRRDSRSLGAKG